MTETEDFLSHAGVKGMKWGVRKDDARGSGTSRVKVRLERKAGRKENREAREAAARQRDSDILAARARINEGRSRIKKLLNDATFGGMLGSSLTRAMNKGISKEDSELANQWTREERLSVMLNEASDVVSSIVGSANKYRG